MYIQLWYFKSVTRQVSVVAWVSSRRVRYGRFRCICLRGVHAALLFYLFALPILIIFLGCLSFLLTYYIASVLCTCKYMYNG